MSGYCKYVYPTGKIHVSGISAQQEYTDRILRIKDRSGELAFDEVGDGVFAFSDEISGDDPVRDGVLDPLDKLFELSKAGSFRIKGKIAFLLETPGDSYENYIVMIEPDGYQVRKADIVNASSEELFEELRDRGVYIGKPQSGEKNWIVTSTASIQDTIETVKAKMVWGTEAQVRAYLFTETEKARNSIPGICVGGPAGKADVKTEKDGSLSVIISFRRFGFVYSYRFQAVPAEQPVNLTGVDKDAGRGVYAEKNHYTGEKT